MNKNTTSLRDGDEKTCMCTEHDMQHFQQHKIEVEIHKKQHFMDVTTFSTA